MNSAVAALAAERFQQELVEYARSFAPFREQLLSRGREGIGSDHYRVYRDNYLFRTSTTLLSLSRALGAVAAQPQTDMDALALLGQTVFEEAGEGGRTPPHVRLLYDSHNIHGLLAFGLPPVDAESVHLSPEVTPEAAAFRQVQKELYSSPSYPKVMGAFFAQESVAESMLQLFYDAFFLPFRGDYEDGSRFVEVARYFSGHLNGLEKKHADRARHCAVRACRNEQDVGEAAGAMRAFLNAQLDLWSALDRRWRDLRPGAAGDRR